MLHIVKYSGPFGFIKPWTAVRDVETFSQQFLTPSIIEGMEKKLFPELLNTKGIYRIARYRLAYNGLARQMEIIQSADWKSKKTSDKKGWVTMTRRTSILFRSVLVRPVLHLAFLNEEHAQCAFTQHLCLCRNEDLVYPTKKFTLSEEDFSAIPGFELAFGRDRSDSFLVGYNRFNNSSPMYGALTVQGPASTYNDNA